MSFRRREKEQKKTFEEIMVKNVQKALHIWVQETQEISSGVRKTCGKTMKTTKGLATLRS